MFLFNCINRQYAKKLFCFLNQTSSAQTQIKRGNISNLSGVLYITLNGKNRKCYPGDTSFSQTRVWHKFRALSEPCIFEEVSTTSYSKDSIYKDEQINKLNREDRKTRLNNFNTSELDLKFNAQS